MDIIEYTKKMAKITLSSGELLIINNSLNEVCNGFNIDDEELKIRLGYRREQIEQLLSIINGLLSVMEQ